MSKLTILGDVSILDGKIISNYKINNDFIFNLECVITKKTEQPKQQKVNLYSKDIFINEIFDRKPIAVDIANNHILDFGKSGFMNTIKYLEERDIKYFGAGNDLENYNNPIYIDIDNIKVAILGYSEFDEKYEDISTAKLEIEKIKEDIIECKENNAACIIVNLHWGKEEFSAPTKQQSYLARKIIDAGADLIIGHHPHCIQPYEVYKSKYIFYSLGNTIFPNFEVPCFYRNNYPERVYRKKQMKWNNRSYSVNFDVKKLKVESIDLLELKKGKLEFIEKVSLNKKCIYENRFTRIQGRIRKYLLFLVSNINVDGKMIDFKAIKHEVNMKRRR